MRYRNQRGGVGAATCRYETIRDTMREELNRFQKERASEMSALLRDFALAQAAYTAAQAKAWGELLADLQNVPQ